MTEAVITLLIVLGVIAVLSLAILFVMFIINEDEKHRRDVEFSERFRAIHSNCNWNDIDSINAALKDLEDLQEWYNKSLR